MVPYHQDPEHAAHLQEAPRCQHIRLNGQRCGSPALRGEGHCYFHKRITNPRMYIEEMPFIEDATSLQVALMQVLHVLNIGHSVNYKFCAMTLYALQIACANLKNFRAEQSQREIAESGQAQLAGKNGEKQACAGLLPAVPQPVTNREA